MIRNKPVIARGYWWIKRWRYISDNELSKPGCHIPDGDTLRCFIYSDEIVFPYVAEYMNAEDPPVLMLPFMYLSRRVNIQ